MWKALKNVNICITVVHSKIGLMIVLRKVDNEELGENSRRSCDNVDNGSK
jgi:hypothetical protein